MMTDTDHKAGVAVRDPEPALPQAPQVQDAQSGLLSVIERIAMRPDVDIERMEKLLELRAKEEDRIRQIEREDRAEAAKRAYLSAMALAQSEFKPIGHDRSNTHTKSKYSTLAAIDKMVTPILTKHGFSTSAEQIPCTVEGSIRVRFVISHEAGHERSYEDDFPLDTAGARGTTNKTPVQAKGSTYTYGRRYLKASALDLSFETDDDGNASEPDPDMKPVNADQYREICRLLDDANMSRETLIKHYGGDDDAKLEDFPQHKYDDAVARLKARIDKIKTVAEGEHADDDSGH